MVGKKLACVVLFGVVCGTSFSHLQAQQREKTVNGTTGRLDVVSVDSYQNRIPRELYVLVKQGNASFSLGKKLRDATRYSSKKKNPTSSQRLSDEGNLATPEDVSFVENIFPSTDATRVEPTKLGYRILWNATSALWHHPRITFDSVVDMYQQDGKAPVSLEVRQERIHPALFKDIPGTLPPIFREKIRIIKPKAVSHLSWLTLRFFGSGEDYVWVSSPALKKIRQITGSNRSDPMFEGMLVPNDFLVWSGKVERVKPLRVEAVQIMVPIYEGTAEKDKAVTGCQTYSFSDRDLKNQNDKDENKPRWVSSSIKLYQREGWRVELGALDPYSNDARQVLFIDKESNMPVYVASYSLDGTFRRFTTGILGAIDARTGTEPVILGTIVTSVQGLRVAARLKRMSVCEAGDSKKILPQFDPASFISFKS
jgi:hypothetical protein